jgi:2-polyprenyl-6-methoxyphenol hydroxylase-like FAD-dependent oxidoreductase
MTHAIRHTRTAIIAGCGIGGPVAALALRRAGIDAVIFEAHDGDAEFVGSFLNLASNGLDALDAIDAQHAVRSHGFPTPRMVMWSGSGKRLGEVANGLTRSGGGGSITIERGRLHAALRAEAESRGIRIERGKRLIAASSPVSEAIAHFADGSTATADVLIGADGLHSQVRRLIDPAAPAPRFTRQLSLGGHATLTTLTPTPGVFSHGVRQPCVLRLLGASSRRRVLVCERGLAGRTGPHSHRRHHARDVAGAAR